MTDTERARVCARLAHLFHACNLTLDPFDATLNVALRHGKMGSAGWYKDVKDPDITH